MKVFEKHNQQPEKGNPVLTKIREDDDKRITAYKKLAGILEYVIFFLLIISVLSIFAQSTPLNQNPGETTHMKEEFSLLTNDGKTTLVWSPEANSENDFYLVMRSEDGKTYYPVCMKYGKMTDPGGKFYFTDDHSGKLILYYKICRVSPDGDIRFSKVKTALHGENSFIRNFLWNKIM